MTEYLPAILLSIRGACHFLIFLRVATYKPGRCEKHRKAVGIAAALFAGLNLAEALRILSNFTTFTSNVEPYLPGVMFFVLLGVTWSGGNLAKFIPHKLLERFP